MAANTVEARITKDHAGEWRWVISKGRNDIGQSTEGYKRKRDAIRGLEIVTAGWYVETHRQIERFAYPAVPVTVIK